MNKRPKGKQKSRSLKNESLQVVAVRILCRLLVSKISTKFSSETKLDTLEHFCCLLSSFFFSFSLSVSYLVLHREKEEKERNLSFNFLSNCSIYFLFFLQCFFWFQFHCVRSLDREWFLSPSSPFSSSFFLLSLSYSSNFSAIRNDTNNNKE